MNSLQIAFITKGVPDRRYRIMVNLVRSDRPRYWNFLCVNCGAKVVELQNYEIMDMSDFHDPQNIKNSGVGKSCKNYVHETGACPYTYFFNLN